MDRQQMIIARFKRAYPNATLREISELTGIQITRVHRIFQGSAMRVNEWELFSQTIARKENVAIDLELQNCFERCLLKLSPQGKRKLLVKLQRLEQLNDLVHNKPVGKKRRKS